MPTPRKREKSVDFVHTGPGTLAGRFLRQFWQPIFRAQDIDRGWAKRVLVMNEHLTLYRGESGAVHLLQDRCPHRNTQLSLGSVEGDALRCFYHGWQFSGDGVCLEAPAELESFCRKISVRAYQVREYLGLIFAYLGDDDPPPLPRFPEIEEEHGIPLWVARRRLPFNYFQRLENSVDEVHVHFVHKISADDTHQLANLPKKYDAEETDYGLVRIGIRGDGGEETVRYSHFCMPNMNFLIVPPSSEDDDWQAHLTWRVPETDETAFSYQIERRHPTPKEAGRTYQPVEEIVEAIFDGRMRIQDVDRHHPALFNIQDNVAMRGQGSLYDRQNERLGRGDVGVILLRRIYARELAALRDGAPLKQWRRPASKLHLEISPLATAGA